MVDFINTQDALAHPENYAVDRGHYYRSETKYLSQLVGHEIPPQQRDFHQAVAYLNRASRLGMDRQDEAVMGRMLTALSDQSRFVGDPTMPLRRGENPASHSLQCLNIMERLFAQIPADVSADALPQLRQFTGLALLIHDMGEVLGEAAGVQHMGIRFTDGFSKEQMERIVLKHVLSLAIAHEEAGIAPEAFTQSLAGLTAQLDIAGRAEREESLSLSEVETALAQNTIPPLSADGQARIAQWMAIWEMAEQPEHTDSSRTDVVLPQNPAFVGNLIKSIEHTQGTRHLIRFALKENESDGKNPLHTVPLSHMLRNCNYVEGEVSKLYATASSPLEQSLTHLQRNQVYAVCQNYLDEVLSAYKRNEIKQQGNEQSGEVAVRYLNTLERMIGMYEHAVYEDIAPPAGSRSIGAPYLEAIWNGETSARSLPDSAIAAESITAHRRLQSASTHIAA